MIKWYKKVVFENYANFNGRARRKEYWCFFLANVLILIFADVLILILDRFLLGGRISLTKVGVFNNTYALVNNVYALVTLLPSLGLSVRRLHDVNKSGWFLLISLIPIIGGIWLLILFCSEGTRRPNQYGSDPKDDLEIDNLRKEVSG